MTHRPSDTEHPILRKMRETEEYHRIEHRVRSTLAELARADPALAQLIGKELDDKEQA